MLLVSATCYKVIHKSASTMALLSQSRDHPLDDYIHNTGQQL